jgi:hypothetical protein
MGKMKELHVMSVDPADKHVGMCAWIGGAIVEAKTITPIEMCAIVENVQFDMLVIEEFRLYPWMAKNLGFNDMKTSQMIGAMKYLAQRNGTPVTMQGASIKKPAFELMKHNEFELPKGTQHMKDAAAHGYWWHYGSKSPSLRGDTP